VKDFSRTKKKSPGLKRDNEAKIMYAEYVVLPTRSISKGRKIRVAQGTVSSSQFSKFPL
jgi:hypothetical protein